jgi:hypothetical protein
VVGGGEGVVVICLRSADHLNNKSLPGWQAFMIWCSIYGSCHLYQIDKEGSLMEEENIEAVCRELVSSAHRIELKLHNINGRVEGLSARAAVCARAYPRNRVPEPFSVFKVRDQLQAVSWSGSIPIERM